MELMFLGTGGADWPDTPEEKDSCFRYHASLMIDRKILIDAGPGVLHAAARYPKADLSGIEAVFLTHTHPDHWSTDTMDELLRRLDHPIRLYYHCGAAKNLDLEKAGIHGNGLGEAQRKKLILCPLRKHQKVTVCGITWQQLEANHYAEHGERGSHFLCSKDGVTWFYGCDGGWMITRTWDILRSTLLDGVILDGTLGEDSCDFRIAGHNCLQMCRMLGDAMMKQGMLKPEAKLYLSHFGRTTYACGPENMNLLVEQAGFRMAQDGMIISSEAKGVQPAADPQIVKHRTGRVAAEQATQEGMDMMQVQQALAKRFPTMAGIGDSLASGELVSLNPDQSRCYTDYYELSWGQVMAGLIGITFTNYSAGGLTTKTWYERYGTQEGFLQKEHDLYLIGLGANDSNVIGRGEMRLGSFEELRDSAIRGEIEAAQLPSFAGGYGRILHLITTRWPKAQIIVITDPMPTPIGLMVNDLIRQVPEICPKVLVMDLEREESAAYREQELIDAGLWYLGHMTKAGYRYAAKLMLRKMSEMKF